MSKKSIVYLLFVVFGGLLVIYYICVNLPCPSISSCPDKSSSEHQCIYDIVKGCIRKYPSECHLKAITCQQQIEYDNHNEDLCLLETYYCETEFERWSIFFGSEDFN